MSEQKNGLDLSAVMNMLSENPAILGNLVSALAPKAESAKAEGEKEEEKADPLNELAVNLREMGIDVVEE